MLSNRKAEGPTDPITTEVIWNTLTSFTDEMAMVLERSAYSPMIRDVRDYCAALVDLEGRVIAYNSSGLPTHFSDVGEHVIDGLEVYGRDGFNPGDAVMMNAAYHCGQHANNVLVYTPIFVAGALIGFAATRAHWQDIGGITANRPVFGTTDAVQEGLQVRSVKVHREGQPVPDVMRLIEENLRQPDVSLGDLRAQIGACHIGERRVEELLARYELPTVLGAVEEVWKQSASLARRAVSMIPDGSYEAESFLDDDAFSHDVRVDIKVRIIIEGSRLTVDLSELADQVMGPINSRTLVPIYIAFKAITTPDRPPDIGCFDPLEVRLPEGKLISATPPAAMGSWSWPFATIIDTFFKALAPGIPDRIAAGNSGMAYGAGFFYGKNPRTGKPFVSSDILPVGWGARPYEDGPTSGGMILGYVQDCPIEVTEAFYPIRVNRYMLREGSGGRGEFRGGLGVERHYELLADAFNNGEIARVGCKPWGLANGEEGEPAYNTIVEPGKDPVDHFHGYMNKHLKAGTTVIVRTGGGGGYGIPNDRSSEVASRDVEDGYVSRDGRSKDEDEGVGRRRRNDPSVPRVSEV